MKTMTATLKKYWIKERQNPQLGTYFVGEGMLSAAAARRMENTLYGTNIMRSYDTEGAYRAELQRLRDCGENVS